MDLIDVEGPFVSDIDSLHQTLDIRHQTFLTQDTPGIGGVIKSRPEDFLVDEIPLYQPEGKGEHLYLFIEKRELTTSAVVERLARAFRVARGAVSYAGLKDKHAITRQHFSIHLPGAGAGTSSVTDRDRELMKFVDSPGVKLLWAERHNNKLRRGHLAGNRFVIRIRKVDPSRVLAARKMLDQLSVVGAPNYFGVQRFGFRGDNHLVGRLMIQGRYKEMLDMMLGGPRETDFAPTRLAREAYDRGDIPGALDAWPRQHRPERQALDALRRGLDPERAVRAIDPMQRGFLVSAAQSAVFNAVLSLRMTNAPSGSHGIDTLVPGDLAWKHDSRAVFAVDAATAAAENAPGNPDALGGRVRKLEVSPSGPMWGASMTRAAGVVDQWELQALQDFGLTVEQITQPSNPGLIQAEGARRPLRMPIHDPDVSAGADEHGPFIRLAFRLPRGSFATSVLREIMKNDTAQVDEEE